MPCAAMAVPFGAVRLTNFTEPSIQDDGKAQPTLAQARGVERTTAEIMKAPPSPWGPASS